MIKVQKTVGVIGGLGPEATLDFFGKLLQATNAQTDQEHLHIIINNNPKVPNRHASIAGTGPSCIPALLDSARALERAGVDFLVMACNTAHAYEADIKAAVAPPFISIIDESVKACLEHSPKPQKVGLLAADGCLETELYQKQLEAQGMKYLLPGSNEQAQLMDLIFKVKANRVDNKVKRDMKALADSLIRQDADLILAACTEVPLVLAEGSLSKPMLSSTNALVEATIAYATEAA